MLTSTMQDMFESQRLEEFRRQGISGSDIQFSRQCAMHPLDIILFRKISLEGFLIVVRCPNTSAWAWQGVLSPKPWAVKDKSGSWGTVVSRGKHFVSDYDLMCVWKMEGTRLKKIFVSAADGKEKGRWTTEAQQFVLHLNQQLVSKIQHGCQDDFLSEKNRGVKSGDQFVGFFAGRGVYLADVAAGKKYYMENHIEWPYCDDGRLKL